MASRPAQIHKDTSGAQGRTLQVPEGRATPDCVGDGRNKRAQAAAQIRVDL
jgi:hypothetical protein